MAPKRKAETQGSRILKKQNTETTAEKALRDNCREWSAEETHVVKNSAGLTMFEVVCNELRAKRADPKVHKLGACRWREIKLQFRSPADPSDVLKPPSPPEAVPPALLKACIAAKKSHADRSGLQLYMSTAPVLNRTATCGLLKLALSFNPRCQKQLPCSLDICRWMARTELGKHHEKQFELMLPWVDEVLCVAFKQGGLKAMQFLKLYSSVAELVLPKGPLEKAMNCGEKWSTVQADLSVLVSTCQLGTQLFSFAVLKTLSGKLDGIIAADLADLHALPLITRDSVDNARASLVGKMEQMECANLLPQRRVVDIRYRGSMYTAKITSHSAHASLAIAAAWKGKAVDEGNLPPFWAEKLMFPDEIKATEVPTLEKKLIEPAKLARVEADKMFSQVDSMGGEACLATLKPKFGKCLAVDGEFALEIMLMECVTGEGAAPRLLKRCEDCMPTADNAKSVEDVLQAMTLLANSAMFRLAPKSAQARVQLQMKFLSRILDSRAPEIGEAAKDKSMEVLLDRLQFFVSYKQERAAGSDGGGRAGATLYGKDALLQIFEQARKAHAGSGADLSTVTPLRTFAWLLPDDMLEMASQLVKDVEKRQMSMKVKNSRGGKSDSAPKKDTAVAEAMALFT